MSSAAPSACPPCLRRAWLLGELAPNLEVAWRRRRPLSRVLGMGDLELIEALAGARSPDLLHAHAGFDPAVALARCRLARVEALCRHDPGYPEALRRCDDPPAVLHVAGGAQRLARALERPTVAIVGARRASEYGRQVARSVARELAAAGVLVVSGMALGVDAAAHEGALDAPGVSVAVLGGGADVPYPASKRTLYARLVATGAVVSELPPGVRPLRWCFPARNRLIAALAKLTLVVEATQRSGSLITAAFARELGRDVGAVPGRITSSLAAGTNALLADGALVVRDAADVLEALGMMHQAAPRARRSVVHAEGLDPGLARLLAAIGDGRDTLSALAATPAEVQAAMPALAELELRGLVRRAPGGRYIPLASPCRVKDGVEA